LVRARIFLYNKSMPQCHLSRVLPRAALIATLLIVPVAAIDAARDKDAGQATLRA